jgi:hypothetical protein
LQVTFVSSLGTTLGLGSTFRFRLGITVTSLQVTLVSSLGTTLGLGRTFRLGTTLGLGLGITFSFAVTPMADIQESNRVSVGCRG